MSLASKLVLFLIGLALLGSGSRTYGAAAVKTRPTRQRLPVVPHVDLPRYMGKWFEVARLPMYFQRGCTNSTAEYHLRPDGTVSVLNRALKNGRTTEIRGTASLVDERSKAVFEVRFHEWFSVFIPRARQGNYFIIWLAPDYSAAAVGTPDRRCLWILARHKPLPAATFHAVVEHCRKLGFPVNELLVEKAQR